MKNIFLFVFVLVWTVQTQAQKSETIDGSRFYNMSAKSVECIVINCPKAYLDFKGIWQGEFQAYDKTIKEFRPFHNKIIYDGNCYKNIKNGEIFIVGLKVDIYPEYKGLQSKTDTSLLITGASSENMSTPFLRTIDKENGWIEYKKTFEDKASEMSIWEYDIEKKENQPEMKFRIIDFRNLTNELKNERFVFISMVVGPKKQPYWEGVLVKGSHSKN